MNSAYVAGFVDGEGSIALDRKLYFKNPAIHISNTCKYILDDIQAKYGGYIYKEKIRKPHHKQAWHLVVRDDEAIDMMIDILPYLREPSKIYRAMLIVNNEELFRKGNDSAGKYARRIRIERSFYHESAIPCKSSS